MDLSNDWRKFQEVFFPTAKTAAGAGVVQRDVSAPVYSVVEKDIVVAGYCEHEDLSDWVGSPVGDFKNQFRNREIVVLERAQVDQWMNDGLSKPGFHGQLEYFRSMAEATIKGGARGDAKLPTRTHFLLESLKGWWGNILPSAFGIYLRLQAPEAVGVLEASQDILVIYRRGALESFNAPDLSGLSSERRKQPGDVVKYLSERYLVPVQGVYVGAQDWARWSQDSAPWSEVAVALRSSRMQLVPFRWRVATLVATRAFLGV